MTDIRKTPEFTVAVLMAQAGDYLSELGQTKMQLLHANALLAAANAQIAQLTAPQETP